MFFCLNTICVACSGATLYGFAFCKWRLVQPPISFQLVVVPLQHTTRAAPTFPSLSNCLTLRPLNMVTGRPCHGLSSCQICVRLARPLCSRLRVSHPRDRRTDRQTDDGHQCIMLSLSRVYKLTQALQMARVK